MGVFDLDPNEKGVGIDRILQFLKDQSFVQEVIKPTCIAMFGDSPSDMHLGERYASVKKFAVDTSFPEHCFAGRRACTYYFRDLSDTQAVLEELDKAIVGLNFEKFAGGASNSTSFMGNRWSIQS